MQPETRWTPETQERMEREIRYFLLQEGATTRSTDFATHLLDALSLAGWGDVAALRAERDELLSAVEALRDKHGDDDHLLARAGALDPLGHVTGLLSQAHRRLLQHAVDLGARLAEVEAHLVRIVVDPDLPPDAVHVVADGRVKATIVGLGPAPAAPTTCTCPWNNGMFPIELGHHISCPALIGRHTPEDDCSHRPFFGGHLDALPEGPAVPPSTSVEAERGEGVDMGDRNLDSTPSTPSSAAETGTGGALEAAIEAAHLILTSAEYDYGSRAVTVAAIRAAAPLIESDALERAAAATEREIAEGGDHPLKASDYMRWLRHRAVLARERARVVTPDGQ